MVVEGNGHDRARVVRRYLSALDASKPSRTKARTAESLVLRMHQIDIDLLSADPVQRLHLTQERIDLHAEYLRLTTGSEDLAELEKAFARVARAYGERYDISYAAWRQVGVDAAVLAKAGITNNKPARPVPASAPGPAAETETEPAAEAAPAAETEPEAAKQAAAKKQPQPQSLKAVAKKAPAAAKKSTASKNGATRAVKKKAASPPPAEAHLLS